ncbi:MAG: CHC2 zinc finger domain-containing protein [Chloroflexota bacterium]|nr:CHC2 zinc finger domain-containing protein [Chloroflexota bacterium]
MNVSITEGQNTNPRPTMRIGSLQSSSSVVEADLSQTSSYRIAFDAFSGATDHRLWSLRHRLVKLITEARTDAERRTLRARLQAVADILHGRMTEFEAGTRCDPRAALADSDGPVPAATPEEEETARLAWLHDGLFADESTAAVQEAADGSRWMLAQVLSRPNVDHPDLPGILRSVIHEAERELAKRRTPATPTRLSVDAKEVKRRLDLAGFIAHRSPGTVFESRRDGTKWASCPLPGDDDRTPSFAVYPDGHYFCYGCNRGGDLFSFVMLWDGLSFKEATRLLAWEAGLGPNPDAPGATPAPSSPLPAAPAPGFRPVRKGGGRGR